MDAPLVEAQDLALHFGRRAVLSGVSLEVGAGRVHGVLGPCGAGKSVLLRVLAGELPATSGTGWCAPAALVPAENASPLALARALAGEPAVLLVDEPTDGFSADTRAAVRTLVARHTSRGGAAVWATRRLDTLHGVASTVTLLAGGRVRYVGSVEALVLRALAQPTAGLTDRFFRAA